MTSAEAIARERYELCRGVIAERLFEGEDPGEITQILKTDNFKNPRQVVSRLCTSGGKRLYYKPHDCRSSELLGSVNELLYGKRLVPIQVSGAGFAFQEEIERRRPKTEEERASFFTWMGRLTAVLYALGSVDMHVNNVYCCGDLPVVIDTETLLRAKANRAVKWERFPADYGKVFPDCRMSVEECSVLPMLTGLFQISPLLPGEGCTVEGYEAHFLSGFAEGYRKIVENRASIFQILDRHAATRFRCILRRDAVYGFALADYRSARTKEQKTAVFQKMEKPFPKTGLPCWEKVLAYEKQSISEGDLPLFTVLAGGRDIMFDGDVEALVPDFLERSPIDEAKQRMEWMGEEDLGVQAAYIRASLKHIDGWTFESRKEQFSEQDAVLSAEAALEEVREAVERLWEERISLSEGRMIWHVPCEHGRSGSLFGLAKGFSGTAVFASACAQSPLLDCETKTKAKAMAAYAFRSMAAFGEHLLESYPDLPEERILSERFGGGFDFHNGITGLIWAIRQCTACDPETAGRLLRGFEGWKLEDSYGKAIARLKQLGATAKDGSLAQTDVLAGGNAGLVAVLLLEAEKGSKSAELLEKAGRILYRMVQWKTESGCYRVFHQERKQYFLPAFLQGSTGIAWVMLRYTELLYE